MQKEDAVRVKLKWEANNGHRTLAIRKDISEDISSHLKYHFEKQYDIPVTIISLKYLDGRVEARIIFHEDPKESASQFKESLPVYTFNALKKLIEAEVEDDLDSDLLNFTIPYEEDWCSDEDKFSASVYKRDCGIEVLEMQFIPEFYGQQKLL